MKKRLLFYFSFVTFMIFSFTRCSQDFLETSDESENFAREARLYFEQNAPVFKMCLSEIKKRFYQGV